MFFAVDFLAVAVFFLGQLGTLGLGDFAVGLGGGDVIVQFGFTLFQIGGFLAGECTGSLAGLDAFFLVGGALVDHRRVGAGGRGGSLGENRGDDHAGKQCCNESFGIHRLS